jgi:RimJ/RimL family protein N-acetyltransferase
MTRMLSEFVPWAFERFDLIRIEAGVFETNPASARVLEKAGFALEARLARSVIKDGQILDRLLYVRFRD